MRVAFVHEWFTTYAGSEWVLGQMLEVLPHADLFAIVDFMPQRDRGFLHGKKVTTSFIQKLPFARGSYRKYLPLMPLAVEQFDVSGYDVVISSSHAVAKGVLTGPDQLHICMCYSPMRYAWDLHHEYLSAAGLRRGPKSWLARATLHYLRQWDLRTANGVDEFIAISRFIQRRIRKVYRRDSEVIYPPLDIDKFPLRQEKDGFYLAASRLVPYKRMDLIAESFRWMPEKKLVIIGDGPQMRQVRKAARGASNIDVQGYQPDAVLVELMQRARALIFAAKEDFGIVPLEAQACGTPVIAFGEGGARETVVDGQTGLFFRKQTTKSLIEAVRRFEDSRERFSPSRMRSNADLFNAGRFREEFGDYVQRKYEAFQRDRRR